MIYQLSTVLNYFSIVLGFSAKWVMRVSHGLLTIFRTTALIVKKQVLKYN